MTDDETIGKVCTWLATVTGCVVIQAYQSGPRPALPYIMVNLTGTDKVRDRAQDIEYIDLAPDELQAAPILEVEWRFSVHGYGATGALSTDLLRRIHSALELTQVMEPLWPDLRVHETSQTRNVPEFVNQVWEPRAQLDMMLRGITADGFIIDPIEQHTPAVVNAN